jgi:hypothetical protein
LCQLPTQIRYYSFKGKAFFRITNKAHISRSYFLLRIHATSVWRAHGSFLRALTTPAWCARATSVWCAHISFLRIHGSFLRARATSVWRAHGSFFEQSRNLSFMEPREGATTLRIMTLNLTTLSFKKVRHRTMTLCNPALLCSVFSISPLC